MENEEKAKYKLLSILSSGRNISLERAKSKAGVDDNYELLVILLKIINEYKIKRNTKYESIQNIDYLIKFINKLIPLTLITNRNKIEFLLEDSIKHINQGIKVINDQEASKLLEKQSKDLDQVYKLVQSQRHNKDLEGIFDSIINYIDKSQDFYNFKYLFDKNKFLFKIKDFGRIEFLDKILDKAMTCINNGNKDRLIYYSEILNFFLTSFRGNDRNLLLKEVDDEISALDKSDSKIKLLEHLKDRIHYDFNKEIKAYSDVNRDMLVFNESFEKGSYINLTNKKCITIDRNGAKSLEDGMIFEQLEDGTYLLISCISDANMYVKEGSRVDEMACNLGQSTFHNGDLITMLPSILTYNHCSLNKGFNRFCYAYAFRFDSNFNVIEHNMYRALVNVSEKYTFSDIDKYYKSGSCPNVILNLINMSMELQKQNPSMEKYHQSKSEINPGRYPNGYGALIIEQVKVLVNSTRANLFYKEGLPYIYRNNIIVDGTDAINDIISNAPNKKVVDIMSSLQPKYGFSSYSGVNKGHVGVGKDAYAHMSIPVRNYAALFNQRMDFKFKLCNNFTDQDVYLYSDKAKKIAEHLNEQIVINSFSKFR